MKRVLGLIPARGGSKGIPGKNMALLAGKPLIRYTIDAALKANSLQKTFLSTDSSEVAEYCSNLGVSVPFLRPADLSGDSATMFSVVKHFLQWELKNSPPVDAVVLLQPTSPLRPAGLIDQCLNFFGKSKADTLVTTVAAPHRYLPSSLMLEKNGYLYSYSGDPIAPKNRQQKENLLARNGPALLIFKPENLERGSLYGDKIIGFPMNEWESIDIDTPFDMWLTERILESQDYAPKN